MELNEFSNEFDVLYNNITSNQAPGLDEYEKSVFLTLGLNDILRGYFSPRLNKVLLGFDDSRKRLADFSTLIKTKTLSDVSDIVKFDNRSVSFRIPDDLFLFINEACNDKNRRYVVIPLSYEEYDRLMLKPYQYPIKRGVWRLIVDSNTSHGIASTHIGDSDGILSIVNSSDKKVTLTLNIVSTPFDTVLETSEDGHRYYLTYENIGQAPIITDDSISVNIECNISDTITSTSEYWSKFILPSNNPWKELLNLYIGDMTGQGDSVFPSVTISLFNGLSKVSVTATTSLYHVELIGRFDKQTLTYTLRYLRRPRPIVLTDLEDGLSIQGVNTLSTCELDESLHLEILQRAVELAKAAYIGDLQSQIALGLASKTDIGVVAQSR